MSPGKARLANLALLFVATFAALALAEVGLRFALNPGDFLQATLIEDPVLGHRIEPFSTGHDALGYRNSGVPTQADIVAIGDSMTYGVSASRDLSWPQQLGRLRGKHVYNMALGGYGPLHYLHLARTSAAKLKPELLVIGVYFGNDLMDAYNLAHGRPHWDDWRVSSGTRPGPTAFDLAGAAEPRKRLGALRDWLARHSLLYCVLKATVLQQFAIAEQDAAAEQANPDAELLWTDPADRSIRTIFKPKLRLAALDLDDSAVREGMQISKRALVAIKLEAQRQGAGLLVVLIPTKERVYCRYLTQSGSLLSTSFKRLCEAESTANADLASYVRSQGIASVDALPALESHANRHLQIYPKGADGHPSAAGYAAIADTISVAIQSTFPSR